MSSKMHGSDVSGKVEYHGARPIDAVNAESLDLRRVINVRPSSINVLQREYETESCVSMPCRRSVHWAS